VADWALVILTRAVQVFWQETDRGKRLEHQPRKNQSCRYQGIQEATESESTL
jgi:hypothetical protein